VFSFYYNMSNDRRPMRAPPGCGMLAAMPRPALTTALIRLAELRTQRDRLATERRRILVRDDPDRAEQLRELDATRLEVEAEIRQARSVVDALRVGRAMARAG